MNDGQGRRSEACRRRRSRARSGDRRGAARPPARAGRLLQPRERAGARDRRRHPGRRRRRRGRRARGGAALSGRQPRRHRADARDLHLPFRRRDVFSRLGAGLPARPARQLVGRLPVGRRGAGADLRAGRLRRRPARPRLRRAARRRQVRQRPPARGPRGPGQPLALPVSPDRAPQPLPGLRRAGARARPRTRRGRRCAAGEPAHDRRDARLLRVLDACRLVAVQPARAGPGRAFDASISAK